MSAVILVNTSGKQGISNSASSYNTSRIFVETIGWWKTVKICIEDGVVIA